MHFEILSNRGPVLGINFSYNWAKSPLIGLKFPIIVLSLFGAKDMSLTNGRVLLLDTFNLILFIRVLMKCKY